MQGKRKHEQGNNKYGLYPILCTVTISCTT